MSASCPFCHAPLQVLSQNRLAFAIYDAFPVSPGHSLIIPRRHVSTVFDQDAEEYAACFALVRDLRDLLEVRHRTRGFNIGVNCGETAGQTIPHAHIHLIPRYPGDVPDPRGGIRHIIPGKGQYW
jgi:diadenosine tetraphosphate (Ap4A) HIT family hydrolase